MQRNSDEMVLPFDEDQLASRISCFVFMATPLVIASQDRKKTKGSARFSSRKKAIYLMQHCRQRSDQIVFATCENQLQFLLKKTPKLENRWKQKCLDHSLQQPSSHLVFLGLIYERWSLKNVEMFPQCRYQAHKH